MFDAFLAAFQAHDPAHAVCILHKVRRDVQHTLLRRMRRNGTYRPQLFAEGFTLELEFDFYSEDQHETPQARWRLACFGVQYYRFLQHVEEPIFTMTITRDHILLWGHQYPRHDLWIQDPDQISFPVLAALEEAHRRLVEDWRPFALHFAPSDSLSAEQAAPAGTQHLLASGPKPLIDAYATILTRFGVTFTNQPSPDPFLIVNTTRYQTDPSNPLVMVFGRSYLVAGDIHAQFVKPPYHSIPRVGRRR